MFGNAFMPLAMSQMGRAMSPYDGLSYKPSTPAGSTPPLLNGGMGQDSDPNMAQLNAPVPVGGMDQFSLGAAIGRDSGPVQMRMPKGGGMFGSGKGAMIGQAIAAGINGYLAARGNPVAQMNLQQMYRLREAQMENAQRMRELQAKRYEPMSVGGSLVQLGEDGQYKTLYDAPQAFEKYATALGYEPGTPEYRAAVQDYRLGSWSDPAMEAKRTLEGIRYGYRDDLQDQRLDVTRRGQDLNHQDRQASIAQSNTNNLRSTGVSRSNAQLRAQTQRGAYSYSNGGKGSGKANSIADGTIISNPSTGQRMKRQGGQWVPIK